MYPTQYDAVLGGQNLIPVNAAVLGGIAGVKSRLASPIVESRIVALSEALKYGKAGLELIWEEAINENSQLMFAARSFFTIKAHNDNHLLLDNDKIILRNTESNKIILSNTPFKRDFMNTPDPKYIARANAGDTFSCWGQDTKMGFNWYETFLDNGSCYFYGGLENCQRFIQLSTIQKRNNENYCEVNGKLHRINIRKMSYKEATKRQYEYWIESKDGETNCGVHEPAPEPLDGYVFFKGHSKYWMIQRA